MLDLHHRRRGGRGGREVLVSRPAVFLDRDGTLIEEVGYPSRWNQIRIFPKSFEAVRLLNEAGYSTVVVTNQSGVGRGYLTEAELKVLHTRIAEAFAVHHAKIEAFYYCPHHPRSADSRYRIDCLCRKPAPGLALQAAADLDLDLARSYMIGDKIDDLMFARAIGAAPILVLTGYGAESQKKLNDLEIPPAAVAADLRDAVDWILTRGSLPHP
jgi:D-glycero-D-manno-heptose 1,7-bisphosphate phosphatase